MDFSLDQQVMAHILRYTHGRAHLDLTHLHKFTQAFSSMLSSKLTISGVKTYN